MKKLIALLLLLYATPIFGGIKVDSNEATATDVSCTDCVNGSDLSDTLTFDADWTWELGGNAFTLRDGSATVNGDVLLSSALAVNGSLTFGDASGDIVTVNAASVTFVNDTNISINGGAGGLNFGSSGTFTTMSINESLGRVGIGTQSPTGKLHVTGAANSNGVIIHAGTTASDYALLFNNQANNTEFFIIKGDGSGYLSGAGNFGVGDTSPDYRFEILPSALANYGIVVSSANDAAVAFGVKGSGATEVGGTLTVTGGATFNGSLTASLPIAVSSAATTGTPDANAIYNDLTPKVIGYITNSGTPTESYGVNITSVTDGGTGIANIHFLRDFASTNYVCTANASNPGTTTIAMVTADTAHTATVTTKTHADAAADVNFFIVCHGSQ